MLHWEIDSILMVVAMLVASFVVVVVVVCRLSFLKGIANIVTVMCTDRRLQGEIAALTSHYKDEMFKSRRLSMEKEELQWKLSLTHQQSPLSPSSGWLPADSLAFHSNSKTTMKGESEPNQNKNKTNSPEIGNFRNRFRT